MFCALLISKLSTPFWNILYTYYSKLSKELKNNIKIQADQVVLELLIKIIFDCFDP